MVGSTNFLYDTNGNLTNDGNCKYMYDAENRGLKWTFIYGPGIDEPIMMLDAAGQNRYFYFYDGLGSVVALSHNGQIVEQYRYDAFGNTKAFSRSGNPKTVAQLIDNPFKFTGQWHDSEIDQYSL